MLTRRRLLKLGAPPLVMACAGRARAQLISAARPAPFVPLDWPRDHGAHLDARVEWWTLKGALSTESGARVMGFHMAVLRSKVESAEDNPSRFAPKHVLAARASLSDLSQHVQWHDQRIARIGFGLVEASSQDLQLTLQDWTLARQGPPESSVIQARVASDEFTLDVHCTQAAPLMRHGENGTIHRDPFGGGPTLYYSLPQLRVQGRIVLRKQPMTASGSAWLDHGWGKRMMAPDATGTDSICINMRDGGALMVLRMRRSDGTVVWEAATLRRPGMPDRVFRHEDIRMAPAGHTWRSPATGGQYPLAWTLDLAGERYTVQARMQDQEIDIGNGIGDVFWEGLSDLLDAQGRPVGMGYLEMTGYAAEMTL